MSTLTIGKLAKACGINVDTVRYYEREGLVLPTHRTESGYRIYSHETSKRLNFICRAKNLGFTLKEIKELLELNEKPESRCEDVKKIATNKIQDIETRIADLSRIQNSLKELSEFCPGKGKPLNECSILNHFYGDDKFNNEQ